MPTEILPKKDVADQCPRCATVLPPEGHCLRCVSVELESSLFPPEPPSQMEEPAIEGWKIVRLLAMGGMGELWLARSLEEAGGDLAAIKLPSPGRVESPQLVERFETESEILASLDHPNILQVVDAGTADDGRLFIATEYVEGCDLRRLLRGERLLRERALIIFDKVCAAVSYAHEEGIVHRDLKPGNVLVAADDTVKVADFGLARQLGDLSSERKTSQGDGLGTPYYLAPESMRAAVAADERADVYGLGVMLYELLSGAVPQGAFTPLSERSGLSKAWDPIINAALHDDPEKRLESVEKLRVSVAQLWEREQRQDVHRQRRKQVVTGSVLVLAGMLAAGAFYLFRLSHPDFPPATEASVASPWVNSVGMQMVPVPEYQTLIATTETTLEEFSKFHRFDSSRAPDWRAGEPGKASAPGTVIMNAGGWELNSDASPLAPGYPVTPLHPITGITSTDAWAFCTWLTLKERAEGRITEAQRYRLPTFREWLRAAHTGDASVGNFAGQEAQGLEDWPASWVTHPGEDPYPHAAPVDALPPNANGIRGGIGNVSEWVLFASMLEGGAEVRAQFTGRSWSMLPYREGVRPRPIAARRPGFRRADIGFRVVLELGSAEPEEG